MLVLNAAPRTVKASASAMTELSMSTSPEKAVSVTAASSNDTSMAKLASAASPAPKAAALRYSL